MKKDYRLYALKKINMAAKAYKADAKKYYNSRQHGKCQYYKRRGNYLYLLKNLVIQDLIDDGIITLTGTVRNNKSMLNEYNAGYFNYHLIASEDNTNFDTRDYIKPEQYTPHYPNGFTACETYLKTHMSKHSKNIMNLFDEKTMEIKLFNKLLPITEKFDMLRNSGVGVSCIRETDSDNLYGCYDYRNVNIKFVYRGTELGILSAYYINDEDDPYVLVVDELGFLACENGIPAYFRCYED